MLNNPLIPGDPFSYDLKWIVRKLKMHAEFLESLKDHQDIHTDQIATINEEMEKIVELYEEIESGFFPDNKYVVHFETAEQLQASSDTLAGAVVQTKGFYAAGDVGAAVYVIAETEPAGPYIMTADGKYAELLINDGKINVAALGAKGDSVTDNSTVFSTAQYYSQKLRTPIFVPRGDYLFNTIEVITDDPTLVRYLNIIGEDQRGTVLRSAGFGNPGHYMISHNPADTTTLQNFYIGNLTMIGNTGENVRGIRLNYATRGKIENLILRNIDAGIHANHTWCMIVDNLYCRDYNATGYSWVRLEEQCNDWTFINCYFSTVENSVRSAVVLFGGMSTVVFIGCTFQWGRGISLLTNASGHVQASINVIGCYFEWMDDYCIYVQMVGDSWVKGLSVTGCYFNGKNDGAASAIRLANVKNALISGNYAVRYTEALIDNVGNVGAVYQHIVSGNNIDLDTAAIVKSVPLHVESTSNAAPASGYHNIGEIVWNFAAASIGATKGWRCIAAGTPGTWEAF